MKVLLFDALIAGFLSRRCFLNRSPGGGHVNPAAPSSLARAENWSTHGIIVIMRHHVKRIPVGPRGLALGLLAHTIIKPSRVFNAAFTHVNSRARFFVDFHPRKTADFLFRSTIVSLCAKSTYQL